MTQDKYEMNHKILAGMLEKSYEVLHEFDKSTESAANVNRNLLMTMIGKFSGGPVGLDTLAAAIGEDAGTIEDVYEPYLIKNGFINRTPRGRVVTEQAYHHLGLEMPAGADI